MLQGWLARSGHKLVDPGARQRETHLADYEQHRGAVAHWLHQFLGAWLGHSVNPDQTMHVVSR